MPPQKRPLLKALVGLALLCLLMIACSSIPSKVYRSIQMPVYGKYFRLNAQANSDYSYLYDFQCKSTGRLQPKQPIGYKGTSYGADELAKVWLAAALRPVAFREEVDFYVYLKQKNRP